MTMTTIPPHQQENSSIIVCPEKFLEFHHAAYSINKNSKLQAQLTISNPPTSTTHYAFKFTTNRKDGYVTHPSLGILSPGEIQRVIVTVTEKTRISFLVEALHGGNNATTTAATATTTTTSTPKRTNRCNDKLRIETYKVSRAFASIFSRDEKLCLVGKMNEEERIEALKSVWDSISSEACMEQTILRMVHSIHHRDDDVVCNGYGNSNDTDWNNDNVVVNHVPPSHKENHQQQQHQQQQQQMRHRASADRSANVAVGTMEYLGNSGEYGALRHDHGLNHEQRRPSTDSFSSCHYLEDCFDVSDRSGDSHHHHVNVALGEEDFHFERRASMVNNNNDSNSNPNNPNYNQSTKFIGTRRSSMSSTERNTSHHYSDSRILDEFTNLRQTALFDGDAGGGGGGLGNGMQTSTKRNNATNTTKNTTANATTASSKLSFRKLFNFNNLKEETTTATAGNNIHTTNGNHNNNSKSSSSKSIHKNIIMYNSNHTTPTMPMQNVSTFEPMKTLSRGRQHSQNKLSTSNNNIMPKRTKSNDSLRNDMGQCFTNFDANGNQEQDQQQQQHHHHQQHRGRKSKIESLQTGKSKLRSKSSDAIPLDFNSMQQEQQQMQLEMQMQHERQRQQQQQHNYDHHHNHRGRKTKNDNYQLEKSKVRSKSNDAIPPLSNSIRQEHQQMQMQQQQHAPQQQPHVYHIRGRKSKTESGKGKLRSKSNDAIPLVFNSIRQEQQEMQQQLEWQMQNNVAGNNRQYQPRKPRPFKSEEDNRLKASITAMDQQEHNQKAASATATRNSQQQRSDINGWEFNPNRHLHGQQHIINSPTNTMPNNTKSNTKSFRRSCPINLFDDYNEAQDLRQSSTSAPGFCEVDIDSLLAVNDKDSRYQRDLSRPTNNVQNQQHRHHHQEYVDDRKESLHHQSQKRMPYSKNDHSKSSRRSSLQHQKQPQEDRRAVMSTVPTNYRLSSPALLESKLDIKKIPSDTKHEDAEAETMRCDNREERFIAKVFARFRV